MERHDFYGSVQRAAGLAGQADAKNATQAVLSALGERLDETRSQRLSADLPEEVADHLTDGASGRGLSYEEFLDRVEARTDRAAVSDPAELSRAVVGTVLEHVGEDERDALRERLADLGYDPIVPESGPGAER